jgi:hypothetical protein
VLETVRLTPFGVVVAWLSLSNTGSPPARTRVAALVHCAVTHGMGTPAAVVYGQPEMLYVLVCVTMDWPFAFTRVLVVIGVADPPCEHITVAPLSRR